MLKCEIFKTVQPHFQCFLASDKWKSWATLPRRFRDMALLDLLVLLCHTPCRSRGPTSSRATSRAAASQSTRPLSKKEKNQARRVSGFRIHISLLKKTRTRVWVRSSLGRSTKKKMKGEIKKTGGIEDEEGSMGLHRRVHSIVD